MQSHLASWLQTLAAMAVEVSDPPPTKKERIQAEQQLLRSEQAFDDKRSEVRKTEDLLEKLRASIPALETSLKNLKDATGVAGQSVRHSEALPHAQAHSETLQQEYATMQSTLDSLRKIEAQATKDHEKGQGDFTLLRREMQQVLGHYYRTADPQMIAQYDGVPMDINHGFDMYTEYQQLTGGGNPEKWVRHHYALGAEHTWNERYWFTTDAGNTATVDLTSLTQHEQVTTAIVSNVANDLLRRDIPGATATVGRVGMTVNDGHWMEKPQTFNAIFGHPEDDFRPSVINNSTRSSVDLQYPEVFRERMDRYTRGEGTRTFTSSEGSITYGLPPIGKPILGNSASNSGWNDPPGMNFVKNFYPNHLNIGASEIPSLPGEHRRDDSAASRIEDYSTSNASVHAIVARPRWNNDGTPLKTQYLRPDYESLVETNLWRLTGRNGIPTNTDLQDVKHYPQDLLDAVAKDKQRLVEFIRRNERVDTAGYTENMEGTSFSAPAANGILLAARMRYPNASESEIMDAFCSSCVPITRRESNGRTLEDVQYFVDEKTGYAFSPKAGFGEFVMDASATKDNPDSWLRMMDRLEQMQQARNGITRNGRYHASVEVGEGPDMRRVDIDGQPQPVTIEATRLHHIVTDEDRQREQQQETRIREAFKKVEEGFMQAPLPPLVIAPFMEAGGKIDKLISNHHYDEALAEMQKRINFQPVSPFAGGIASNRLVGDTVLREYEIAAATVSLAREARQQTYEFRVPQSHDACCNFAALRLQFKQENKVDPVVVLESPDGMRIPVDMSWPQRGVAVGSTPAFMRRSAAGTWRLYTREEVAENGSQMVISGTERNKELGILDVREEVLPAIEAREARHAGLKKDNIIPPIDVPHAYLRRRSGVVLPAIPGQGPVVAPSTREQFQQYMQELIDQSELKKRGFIPEGKLEKISRAAPEPAGAFAGIKGLSAVADNLKGLLATAETQPVPDATYPMQEASLASLASQPSYRMPQAAKKTEIT